MAEIRSTLDQRQWLLRVGGKCWSLLSPCSPGAFDPQPWSGWTSVEEGYPVVAATLPDASAEAVALRFHDPSLRSDLARWCSAQRAETVAATAAATTAPETDPVARPGHYLLARGSEARDLISEVCDTLAARGLPGGAVYEIGSALKYLTRLGAKGAPAEDLGKAIRFLEFAREGLGRDRG